MGVVPPILVVISGLPATGKSSIAVALAKRLRIPYLRVDRIEQAMVTWSTLSHPVGAAGYAVAYALAAEQLSNGLDVIVECVNPVALTRDSWVSTAEFAGAVVVEVEVICSDALEHRRRVETRETDVEGLVKPTWGQVEGREYEPWSREHLIVDSAKMLPGEAVEVIAEDMQTVRCAYPG